MQSVDYKRNAKYYTNPADKVFAYLRREYNKTSDNEDSIDTPKAEARNNKFLAKHIPDFRANLTNKVELEGSSPNGYKSPFTYSGMNPGETTLGKFAAAEGAHSGVRNRHKHTLSAWVGSIGSSKLSDLHDKYRAATFDSPLLRSAIGAGILGVGAYSLAPQVAKSLGTDTTIDPETGERVYATRHTRRWAAAVAGLAAMAAGAYLDYIPGMSESLVKDIKKDNPTEDRQLKELASTQIVPASGIKKEAGMFGPLPAAPVGFVQAAVNNYPTLTPSAQFGVNHMLSTFPNPDTMVNSTDLVSAAIASGASGMTGLPIGRIASAAVADYATAYGLGSLVGVANPGRLASTVGLVSAGSRVLGSLFN